MKLSWKRALFRSLLNTAIFTLLFGAFLAWQGQPDWVHTLAIGAAVWFSASLVLERYVYPRFEA